MNYYYSSFTNTNQIFNHEKSDLKNKYNVYEFNLNENHKKEQKRKLSNIYLNSPIVTVTFSLPSRSAISRADLSVIRPSRVYAQEFEP